MWNLYPLMPDNFLGQMDKPDVDAIEGLSPGSFGSIKKELRKSRSTVGTITEVYDYLRLLYASIGIPHCPICGREVRQTILRLKLSKPFKKLPEGSRLMILAPIVRARKGTYQVF
jgi:excinuclease ABC subunit A